MSENKENIQKASDKLSDKTTDKTTKETTQNDLSSDLGLSYEISDANIEIHWKTANNPKVEYEIIAMTREKIEETALNWADKDTVTTLKMPPYTMPLPNEKTSYHIYMRAGLDKKYSEVAYLGFDFTPKSSSSELPKILEISHKIEKDNVLISWKSNQPQTQGVVYEVVVIDTETDTPDWTQATQVEAVSYAYPVTGLENNTDYFIYVRAVKDLPGDQTIHQFKYTQLEDEDEDEEEEDDKVTEFELKIIAANQGGSDTPPLLGSAYGCNLNSQYGNFPGLQWKNLPKDTKSIAIHMIDQTIPWVHFWAINIPSNVTSLPEVELVDVGSIFSNIDGAQNIELRASSYGETALGYQGPCPPIGQEHTYAFEVFALNQEKFENIPTSLDQGYSAFFTDIIINNTNSNVLAKAEALFRFEQK